MGNSLTTLYKWWQHRSARTQDRYIALGVLCFYTLITLIVTWPVVAQLSHGVPGYQIGDQLQKIWMLWHTKEAILDGQNPAYFATLVYPRGYFSPIRWAMLVIPVLTVPLTLLVSPVVAYNLMFLLSYVLTAYTGYLLCKDVTNNRQAAILGGWVLMLFPLRVAHLMAGHLETGSLFMALLYMLLLRRTLLEPRPSRAILTGLVLGLAGMVHVTLLSYVLSFWTILYVACFLLLRAPRFFSWPIWRALLIVSGVAAVVVTPFLIPLINLSLNPAERIMEGGTAIFSADLLSYVSPPTQNPLLDMLGLIPDFAKDTLAFHPQELLAYLGVAPLLLIWLALIRRAPEGGTWLFIALVAMLLALGPYLKVRGEGLTLALNGTESLVVLPYTFLSKLPIFGVGRTPGRINLIAGIALAVLAAQGAAAWLGNKDKVPAWRSGVLLVAAVILSCEYLVSWPMEMRYTPLPTAVQRLADEPPTGGVLNIPVHDRDAMHRALFYQITHGWPLMDGYVSRQLPHEPGLLGTFNWISDDVPKSDIIPAVDPLAARGLLAERGVSYVLVHRTYVRDIKAVESRLEAILGEPLVADEVASLYRVEPAPRPDKIVYALDGLGWGWVEPWNGEPGRWLSRKADLIIYMPQDTSGALYFKALSGDYPRRLLVTVNDEASYTLVIGQHLRYYLPDLTLQAGYNVLRFEAQEPCWPIQGDAHCRINWPLVGLPPQQDCWLSAPFDRCLDVLIQGVGFVPDDELVAYHLSGAQLGESIQLVGHSLQEPSAQPGSSLTLTLIWRAIDTPTENYGFLVRLVEAGTGALVVEYSGSPLREAFVTSQWQAGDLVQEQIVLHLPSDLAPGKYVLLTGMYRSSDGEMLPFDGGRLEPQSGLIWLQDIVVNRP